MLVTNGLLEWNSRESRRMAVGYHQSQSPPVHTALQSPNDLVSLFRYKFKLASTGEEHVLFQQVTKLTEPLNAGDVVGVGYIVGTRQLFFTHNGKSFRKLATELAVGVLEADLCWNGFVEGGGGAIVAGNFGQSAFSYQVLSSLMVFMRS